MSERVCAICGSEDNAAHNNQPHCFIPEMDAELAAAVRLLKGCKIGDCWCQVGTGNPMMSSHSKHCREVAAFMDEHEE